MLACLPAAAPATAEQAVRLHPDDLVLLTARVAEAVAERVVHQMADVLTAKALPDEQAGRGNPRSLLTVPEVVAARPGISAPWLYANGADCGAIRKNRSKSSPLWFRLADVDAELERRRKKPVKDTVHAPAPSTSPRRRARRTTSSERFTAGGAPRRFDISPRKSA
jgi:hypothetical protein